MAHTFIRKAKAEPDTVAAAVRGSVRAAKRRARRPNGEDAEVFQLLSEEELLGLPPPESLIDGGLLTVGAFTVLYGPPSTCKTFVAVHFGCCVATGLKCFERTVKKGLVLFIAAEGVGGLGLRLRAWKKKHSVKGRI